MCREPQVCDTHDSLTNTSDHLKDHRPCRLEELYQIPASRTHGLANGKELDQIVQHSPAETEQTLRHLIVLPTDHSKVLQLKDKLLRFQDRGWQVKDFGAFGAFEWGFILIEVDDLRGYRNFKMDTCSLAEQGTEYIYPEHVACWI